MKAGNTEEANVQKREVEGANAVAASAEEGLNKVRVVYLVFLGNMCCALANHGACTATNSSCVATRLNVWRCVTVYRPSLCF